jgi:hypothetical protein
MRLLVILGWLAGCAPECAPDTVFLDVTLDSSSAQADVLDVEVTVGGDVRRGRADHPRGATSGSVELRFVGTRYPAGADAEIRVQALLGDGTVIGRGVSRLSLKSGCTHTSVTVFGITPEAPDLSQPSDLAVTPDLAVPVWTTRPSMSTNDLRGVAHGPAGFVAVGDGGTIITSTDGTFWTLRLTTITADLRSVAWGDGAGRFVTVGTNGFIATSDDGSTWTPRTQAPVQLNVVRRTSNQFVAAGNSGTILTSPDGITWTTRSSGLSQPLYALSLGNNTVALGANGAATVSTNMGTSWTLVNTMSNFELSCAAWGGSTASAKVYLALGNAGNLVTSNDSVAWTAGSTGLPGWMSGLTWNGDRFLAVGAIGTILASPDGVTWAQETSNTTAWLYDVAYAAGQYVAVGENGTILTSTR